MDSFINYVPTLALEDIEQPEQQFAVGILDVFSYVLSEDEVDKLVIYTPQSFFSRLPQSEFYFYEEKFLNCFQTFLEHQPQKAVSIYCPNLKDLSSKEKRIITTNLDKEERTRFLNVLIRFSDDLLIVHDVEDLKLFVHLSTRQLLFSNFFFKNFAIIGNYELSFPVFCLDEMTLERCREVATSEGLYIRN